MKPIFLSIALCVASSTLYGADIQSSVKKLSGDNSARKDGRVELKDAFASVTAPMGAIDDLMAMEQSVIAALKADSLPLSEQLYLFQILGLYGSAESADAVSSFLGNEQKEVSDSARRALVLIPGSKALGYLVAGLKRGSDEDRAVFIDALAERGDPSAATEVSAYLTSGSVALSSKAAMALGKLGSKDVVPALLKVHTGAAPKLKFDVERALLDIGLDASTAYTLAGAGSSAAIRAAAFRQLLALDEDRALSVLKSVIEQPEFEGRSLFFNEAMNSASVKSHSALVDYLPKAGEADQSIIITAIGENGYSQYESEVLAFVKSGTWILRMDVIHALGNMGGDASFEPLVEALLKEPKNQTIANAVARLKAPSADLKAFSQIRDGEDSAERIASMKVLEMRNAKGATELLNEIAKTDDDLKVREAAFATLENIGNLDTVRLFVDLVIAGDSQMRAIQRSLKRLSLNYGAPDHQWETVYKPALDAAPNAKARESVVLILDGIAGKQSLGYLEKHALDANSELRSVSIRTLQRWTDADSGDVWIKVASQPGVSSSEISSAQRSLVKILKDNDRTTARSRVDLAVKAVENAPNADFKNAIVEVYKNPPRAQKRHVKSRFDKIKNDPDVGEAVKAIIASL
ncbi:MAG: HEAT repeat domain-containing protein [Opitutaceae bacterium]